MRTDLGAFFDHADADFLTGFGGLLFQSASGRQASGAGTDDDHVEFHVFAFHRAISYSRLTVFSNWRFGVASVVSFAKSDESDNG